MDLCKVYNTRNSGKTPLSRLLINVGNVKRSTIYDHIYEDHCYSYVPKHVEDVADILLKVLMDHTYARNLNSSKKKRSYDSIFYCREKFSEKEISKDKNNYKIKYKLFKSQDIFNSTSSKSIRYENLSKKKTLLSEEKKKKKVQKKKKRNSNSKNNKKSNISENYLPRVEFIDEAHIKNEVILVDSLNYDGPEYADTTTEEDPLKTSDAFVSIPIETALEATKLLENITAGTVQDDYSTDDESTSSDHQNVLALQCRGCTNWATAIDKFSNDCSNCGSAKGFLLCIDCKKQFLTFAACRHHFISNPRHRGDKDLLKDIESLHQTLTKCVKCGRRFDNPKSLEMHQYVCGDVYQCSECIRKFYDGEYLIRHMGQYHSECLVYKCSRCNVECTSKELWCDHILSCEADTVSNNENYDENNYTKRIRYEIRKKFECSKCCKIIRGRNAFNWHTSYVCNTLSVPCPNCHYTCLNFLDLQKHMSKHVTEKYLKCEKCDRKYIFKKRLLQHIKRGCRHTSKLQCHHCIYRCYGKANMVKHLQRCLEKEKN